MFHSFFEKKNQNINELNNQIIFFGFKTFVCSLRFLMTFAQFKQSPLHYLNKHKLLTSELKI